MEIDTLACLRLPLRRRLRREDDPAAAAKSGSEPLTPTLIGSWKDCNVHSSGIHTGISSWLPSIYPGWQVLRRWLMMTSLRGLSRWQSTAANLSLIYTPHVHTNACTHSRYLHHLQYTTFLHFFFFFKCCLLPPLPLPLFLLLLLLILSQPTRLPGGCWIRLMMLLYGTCIRPDIAMKSGGTGVISHQSDL